MLNSINYIQIHEYLLNSVEQCSDLNDFCLRCFQLLSQHLTLKNFIIYQFHRREQINLVYQNNVGNPRLDYSKIINIIAKLDNVNGLVEIRSIGVLRGRDDSYYQYLQEEKIEYLFLSKLSFQQEYLGDLLLEIETVDDRQNVEKLLQLINKYLALYCYQKKLKLTEDKLTLEAERLLKAKEDQSTYLSHMNHELRTPIAAVIGFAKLLQQRLYGELNAKQAQYVDAIYQSGTYLLELISDLLDVSKIQAQKEELLIEKTIVTELCESALALVKTNAQEQGLELNLVVQPGTNSCLVDQRRLKQVLVNLLSNAVKFTEKGTITLEVSKDKQYTFFKVIDTGIGIDQQSQLKLFKPFSQLNTHLHRKHKGTGLGLVISRELARLHGGDITLVSEQNQGSCFTVSIPHLQS